MKTTDMTALGIRLPPKMWNPKGEGGWIHEVMFNYSCKSGQDFILFMICYFEYLHKHKLIDEEIVAKVKQIIKEIGGKDV